MSKVCFLCPIYDSRNHFDFGYGLVESMKKCEVSDDIYFIFSNDKQQEDFLNKINNLGYPIKSLVLPESMLDYKSKVVVKKLYGLQHFMNDYRYIILIDCETIFVKNADFGKVCKEIIDNNSCLNSNVSYDGFYILRSCFKTMGLYHNKKLRKEFCNFKYNFWFNEIQVYDCKLLPGFFDWLDKFDKDAIFNQWNCFEYYIYAAYLILEHNFKIRKFRKLKSMGGIMEYMPSYSHKKQEQILETLGTHWTSSNIHNENTILQFHLDRTAKTGYSYGSSKLRLKIKRMIILLLNK